MVFASSYLTNIHHTPCFRNAILYGIASGVILGAIRIAFHGKEIDFNWITHSLQYCSANNKGVPYLCCYVLLCQHCILGRMSISTSYRKKKYKSKY